MAIHSKFLQTLPYTCYEVGHTWTPSCTKASLEVALVGLQESFRTYAPLYVIAGLLKKKDPKYFLKKVLPEIIRSTIFLASNSVGFIASFCVVRLLFGRIYFLTASFIPALIASYISILMERKDRRGMLALYLTNLASETMYRMAVARGHISPVKNGEVLLFSITMAVYMYLYRNQGLKSSVNNIVTFLVGPSETSRNGSEVSDASTASESTWRHMLSQTHLSKIGNILNKIHDMWKWGPKQPLCRHEHSCFYYGTQGFVRMFLIGYCIHGSIKLLSLLKTVIHQPHVIWHAFKDPLNLGLGAMLGGFAGIFRSISCLLRWLRTRDDRWHAVPAGFFAGLSMFFYPSSTIALYLMWKLIEIIYFKGVTAQVLPYLKNADIHLYAFSTAFVFHAAVLEPHNLRPQYWKFMNRLSNKRFSQMNRKLLDTYGTCSSKLFPSLVFEYDGHPSSLK